MFINALSLNSEVPTVLSETWNSREETAVNGSEVWLCESIYWKYGLGGRILRVQKEP